MSRWFRHYAGMMRDDKLVRVALRSKQPIERVCWIWGAILESAAEIDDGGRFDVDAAEVAYFLRADEADVDAVLTALADAERVADNSVVNWGTRQFSSDRSKDRVAAHRERKRQQRAGSDGEGGGGNGDVTLHTPTCNAPETETETETYTEEADASHQCAPAPLPPVSDAVEAWNNEASAAGWPTIAKLNDTRRRNVGARLREHGLDGWRNALTKARASPYLGGDPPTWFTFDWLTKPTNFLKLIEGNYDRRHEEHRGGTGTGGRMGGPKPDPTLALVRAARAAQSGDAGDYRRSWPALPSR